jgi:hypothetical protein
MDSEMSIAPNVQGNKRRLTHKMILFCDEYISGAATGKPFNGRAAAQHAGYAVPASNPSTVASTLLRHPLVQEYIKKQLDSLSMSAAEVLARFTDIARLEVGSVVKVNSHGRLEIDAEAVLENKKFIKQFGFDSNGNPKIEFHDSHAALRDIARVRGMMKDGLEVSGPGGGSVPVAMTVNFVAPNGQPTYPTPEQPKQLADGGEEFDEIEDE